MDKTLALNRHVLLQNQCRGSRGDDETTIAGHVGLTKQCGLYVHRAGEWEKETYLESPKFYYALVPVPSSPLSNLTSSRSG